MSLIVLVSSLLTLNYFTPFLNFSIVDFKQANVCWENYQTFYWFDICFNVSTGRRQDLIRSNVGNSNSFLILYTFFETQNRAFFILENHTIKDLYEEAFYKIFMIFMKYNTRIYYAKSTMREKKRWNRILFYKK